MGGCIGDQPKRKGNGAHDNTILILVRRIKHDFELKQLRRDKEWKEQEQLLLQNFHKEAKSRGKTTEEGMISRTLYFKHITEIYFICETEAKIILDYKESLQHNMKYVQSSLQTLVYSSSILKEPLLQQLQTKLKQQFPEFQFPEEKDIRHDIVKWHKKTDQIEFDQLNAYVMDFSNRYGISMEQIRGVGHGYGYGAKQK